MKECSKCGKKLYARGLTSDGIIIDQFYECECGELFTMTEDELKQHIKKDTIDIG